MPRIIEGTGPEKGDLEGANQSTPAAGGAGPRGIGLKSDSPNPPQWGQAGQSPQPETAGGRKGEEEPVRTSWDRELIAGDF